MPPRPPARASRLPLLTVAVLAVGLLSPAAASAAAAPGWTAPVELDTNAGVAGLAVDGRGARLVDGRRPGARKMIDTRLIGISAGGQPAALRTLKGTIGTPVALGTSGLLYARERARGTVGRTVPDGKGGTKRITLTRYRLGVSVGRATTAALGTMHSHGSAVLDEGVRIAAAPDGGLLMGWSDVGDDGVVRVYASWRAATKRSGAVRLGHARKISGSRSSRLLALAVGVHGRAALVFQTGASEKTRRLYVRPLDLRKGKLGKIQTLRRGGPGFPSATAAIGPKGRAVIAWGEQDGAAERAKPYVVRATTRDTARARFRVPRRIDKGGTTVRAPGGALVAAVDSAGRATVAWSQTVGSVADGTAHDIPRVAEAGATGRLGAARDLAAAGRVHGIATTVSGARTGLVFVREQGQPLGGSNGDRGVAVQAAFRPAGGTLGAPETIDQLSDAQMLNRSNAFGSAAIGALPDGRFTVAWTRATIAKGKLRSATLFSDRTAAP